MNADSDSSSDYILWLLFHLSPHSVADTIYIALMMTSNPPPTIDFNPKQLTFKYNCSNKNIPLTISNNGSDLIELIIQPEDEDLITVPDFRSISPTKSIHSNSLNSAVPSLSPSNNTTSTIFAEKQSAYPATATRIPLNPQEHRCIYLRLNQQQQQQDGKPTESTIQVIYKTKAAGQGGSRFSKEEEGVISIPVKTI
ncbi:hypothetical protein DFA_04641 [Cavenderia fasciculata]|uniref:Uncharacterized protein n=1 Tax=Cavenderia fasciculata TaxID=261658 RepID=F4PQ50_CACFS|nr:uncharacterized protein DFA_04641 [Cavenderia fasciculata]EGG22513.1 hypothetical protein DFA_04641 [Cavenderia fasciculata]|eukprot:XP_004360364.1 hypothetical protein DFA_04641 [Cavenderia fasciculata]